MSAHSCIACSVLLVVGVLGFSSTAPAEPAEKRNLPLSTIELPPGFRIELYAGNVPGARSMTASPSGTVFVGTREKDSPVYALVDKKGDRSQIDVITIAKSLHSPNGVAYHDGALYVAEVSRILRYDGIEKHLANPPRPVVVTDKLPTAEHHGWKFIAFGPDGWLYVPVGAPCNICEEEDPRFASILRMKQDGSGSEVFAHGIRNTVGFDWHPTTKELWFTDNGRDYLGDDSPPDELNHAPKKGLHFGFPYCHGGSIPDGQFGQKRPCSELVPPVVKLPAHVAAIGMRFYRAKPGAKKDGAFPAEYDGQIFIAEHGSWNRSTPVGYRITLVRFPSGGGAPTYEVFAKGWLKKNGVAWGRPSDVLEMADGSLLVSDDRAGAVYRISYAAP